jgi:hypothetical protein
VQWLLDEGQVAAVTRLLWKSVKYGYDEPVKGFAEEMAKAGEVSQAEHVLDQAEDRHYVDEAEQIRAGLKAV